MQFAVSPDDGEVYVIEMNPRVSRSSALASKATGFPIAKLAALLAVGYLLHEIPNDITQETPASFEPSLDYVVVKIPRWNFEKFTGVEHVLGPQMKAVGEVMAIGRTFPEALQKGVRSLDIGEPGFGADGEVEDGMLEVPTAQRLFQVASALYRDKPLSTIARETGFDPWFIQQMIDTVQLQQAVTGPQLSLDQLDRDTLLKLRRQGFSDASLAQLLGTDETALRGRQRELGLRPSFYRVDTCAAEFEAKTPYLYSTWEMDGEAEPGERRKIMVLGGGPNRIGQGIEFDYCCVHACFALRDMGFETIMVNCNPETVSTDYDTADKLYFEPLTAGDVLNIIEEEQPEGVLVQFGGQTPLNIAGALDAAGAPIIGTPFEAIDLAEDRERFGALMNALGIRQPAGATAHSREETVAAVEAIGFPLLVRPSYVLGGRGMAIIYDMAGLNAWLDENLDLVGLPLLIDRFLEDAVEVDVDALCDGERVTIGGIMQHIENAGVHSGDSACVLPPWKLGMIELATIRDYTRRIGLALGVRGLFNIQFAIQDDEVYVLEANPRASRTTPYVSKATGVPLARMAAQIAAGQSLAELGFLEEPPVDGFFIKEAVLPFRKFPGADARLSPEMRSTGEVMGHASSFGHAFVKAQMSTGASLPTEGVVAISVSNEDKGEIAAIARDFHCMGFELVATEGTARMLNLVGVPARVVRKEDEPGPNVLDMLRAGEIALVITTPTDKQNHSDGSLMRSSAWQYGVPIITTLQQAAAAAQGIHALRESGLGVRSLQAHHAAQPN